MKNSVTSQNWRKIKHDEGEGEGGNPSRKETASRVTELMHGPLHSLEQGYQSPTHPKGRFLQKNLSSFEKRDFFEEKSRLGEGVENQNTPHPNGGDQPHFGEGRDGR